jgi:excisionase family DNA binding protein
MGQLEGTVNEREVVRPAEAAAILGIGRGRVLRLVASGELPALRLGPRSLLIPLSGLREWVKARATAEGAGSLGERSTGSPET